MVWSQAASIYDKSIPSRWLDRLFSRPPKKGKKTLVFRSNPVFWKVLFALRTALLYGGMVKVFQDGV